MASIDSLMQKIAEQEAMIKDLQQQNEYLKFMLAKQKELSLVSELASMVEAHQDKAQHVMIASLHKH